jgi:hypothetical protein
MNTSFMEQLAALSTPARLAVEGDSDREQRNWVVRLVGDLPGGPVSAAIVSEVDHAAKAAVREARAARELDPASIEAQPTVHIKAVDPRHVVVNVTTIRLEKDDAHAYLVGACAALRALETSIPVEDIQGIPRRFWGLLVGP